MFGLTALGTLHTAISLVALAAGVLALARHLEISPGTSLGRIYVWATVLTCLTGFGIFQHGGFGKPHALGVLTLLVLGVAALATRRRVFGKASPYVATVSYSATLFFHMIPGLTETFTRLPLGAPLFTRPEDPALQKAVGACFVVFVVGAALQVRRLWGQRAQGAMALGRQGARP
ncbi:hypothetical protein [Variovorax sp. OV329]|uniref:hypothetical protein n=1 Tax=Variovorax sp. OV329 TaxID=1882825 RepID=UPI0008E6DEFC|nr:hypothetical protein [Variovorax sp. OV329]SFM04607.1 hypothetical protein SAMN05444747_102150 [Variovorax sp. OV329]